MSQMNQNMKGKAGTSPLVRGLYIVGNIVLYVFVIVVAVEASHSCCYVCLFFFFFFFFFFQSFSSSLIFYYFGTKFNSTTLFFP